MILPTCRVRVRPRWSNALSIVLLGASAGQLLAADPLKHIPADACAVVVFPNLEKSLEQFTEFARTINPDFAGLELDDVEDALNIEGGVLDPTQPVAVIFPRPMFAINTAIIAFVPEDLNEFEAMTDGRDGVAVPYNGLESDGFAMMRDGCCFVARTRKALRILRPAADKCSLMSSLDAHQKKMLDEGEAFVHIPLARWREEKINPMFMLATRLIRLSISSTEMPGDAEAASAMMDYVVEALRLVLDEMQSVTLSVYLDQRAVHFEHHHRFDPLGKSAEYLRQSSFVGGDSLAMLPDKPFLFAVGSNQRNKSGESISARVCRGFSSLRPLADKLNADTQKKMLDTLAAFHSNVSGSCMMLGMNTETGLPMYLLGGYAVSDAKNGIEQLKYIQENAEATLAAIMPGAGTTGTFESVKRDGVDCLEMRLVTDALHPQYRRQLEQVYGKNATYQQAVLDKTHVVYSLAQPPIGVSEFHKTQQSGRTLGKNAHVQRIRAMLPEKSNLVIMGNVGALLTLNWGLTQAPDGAKQASMASKPPDSACWRDGPMIGWSMQIAECACTGTLAMEAGDLANFVKLAKSVQKDYSSVRVRTVKPPKAPKAPIPPEAE
ncbi:MAG: hypothetical protein AABZ08_01215 [Planctomycetota bacterium]